MAGDSPYDSPSKRASLEAAFAIHAPSRNSMELAHTVLGPADQDSLPPGAAPSAAFDARATSFSGSSTARKDYVATTRSESVGHGIRRGPPSSFSMPTPFASQRSLAATLNRSLSSAKIAPIPALPNIYPALLSRVADAFKQCIILSELIKDGLAYKDSFDGRTAVTMIAEIIKTPDRNLALLLGRALDAQKLFHDVTYDHRLRDNPGEVYQFRERLTAPFIPENNVTDSPMSEHGLSRGSSIRSGRRLGLPKMTLASDSGSIQTSDSQTSFFSNATPGASTTDLYPPTGMPQLANNLVSATSAPLAFDDDSEEDLPVGVFTLLTDCYSPTCTREQLCYSINCPRRLEQMKRLNMKPQPGLSRKLSNESLHDVKVGLVEKLHC